MLYSTAHDNGDSFSLSYIRSKAGKMQSTINQLEHRKGRAVCTVMLVVVWSHTIITALPSVLHNGMCSVHPTCATKVRL